jgi:hypothetical protein
LKLDATLKIARRCSAWEATEGLDVTIDDKSDRDVEAILGLAAGRLGEGATLPPHDNKSSKAARSLLTPIGLAATLIAFAVGATAFLLSPMHTSASLDAASGPSKGPVLAEVALNQEAPADKPELTLQRPIRKQSRLVPGRLRHGPPPMHHVDHGLEAPRHEAAPLMLAHNEQSRARPLEQVGGPIQRAAMASSPSVKHADHFDQDGSHGEQDGSKIILSPISRTERLEAIDAIRLLRQK